jgi:hypothetical protein
VDSQREGTPYCFISCDEPRLLLAFRGDVRPADACESMLDAAARVSDDAELTREDFSECFVGGSLRGSDDASLTATVTAAEHIAAIPDYEPTWVRQLAERFDGELIIEVRLNSGID